MIDKILMLKLQDVISIFGDKYSVECDKEINVIRVQTSSSCITSTLLDSILVVSPKITFNSFYISKVDGKLTALFCVYE